jgi:IclR family acetate operon transcriptional repressor
MEVSATMPVQSVDRAVAILDALRARGDYLGVTELSNELGLHKSTVHRLLVSLRKGGLVERDPRTRRYRLGIRLVELGYAVLNSRGLPQVALPYLHYLADTVQEVCYLAIRDGDKILNVLQVPAPHMVQSVSWLGAGSLHATSAGKVLLAHMQDEAKEPYLEGGLESYTDNTITEASQLRSELESVRERGYATSWEEEAEGVNTIAVPLWKPDGAVVAAIGLAGPSFRFTREKALEVPEMMIGVAREIGKKLDPKPSKVFV